MRTNRNNDGRSFEKSLEIINGQYERQGRATFSKVSPPVRIIGWGSTQKVIFLDNPFVDYVGCITEQGNRMAAFEAKSTGEPTLPAGGDQGLKRTQIDAMTRWRAAGAATWLLWELDGKLTFWTLDMVKVTLTTRKSLQFDNGHEVEAGKGFCFHDFLSTVRRFEKFL